MTALRFDPARAFETAARKMNELISEVDKGVSIEFGGFAPRVDISEDSKNLYISAELPGLAKEDVKISVNEENIISIRGEKKRKDKINGDEDRSPIRTERAYGAFSRAFALPDSVDRESVSAKFDKGVLEIALTKKVPAKPKEVEVTID